MYKRILLIIVLVLICHIGLYATHPMEDNIPAKKHLPADVACKKESPLQFRFAGLELKSDSNTIMHDFRLSVSVLSKKEMPPLRSNMYNVTGDSIACYRLLPDGEHFRQPATIRISYSPSLLPRGYRPEDVYTFCYDSLKGRWSRLERVKVDTIRHYIISRTTHFTDFINAVFKTPEMPEVQAYVPTTITDLEHPNPLARVQMLSAPEANPYGNATITYPVVLPLGRNGLQPDVDLTYNSDSKDGILGLGWSMPQPAISIDTRWGVPRYNNTYETEIYTLDGEQLVLKTDNEDLLLPYQNHTQDLRISPSAEFQVRNILNTDKVIRHGVSPASYWWEVRRSDGTTLYYGKYADGATVVDSCVLRDARRHIGYWPLCEVEDIYGNFMTYVYHKDSVNNELYLTAIHYTGHRSNDTVDFPPPYSVEFGYGHCNRLVHNIDGRLGFIRTTTDKLCYINITHSADNQDAIKSVRRYDMSYDYINGKMVLNRVVNGRDMGLIEVGSVSACDDHYVLGLDTIHFDYYHQDLSHIFSNNVDTIQFGRNYIDQSVNKSWDIGGTLTVGFGFKPWSTNFSVGGNYDYSEAVGKGLYQLFDIDGDALVDMVYCKHDSICYRKHIIDANGKHSFGEERNTGIQSENLSKEVSKTNNWGLQAGADPIISASGGWSSTDTYTSCYFADVNADGLPDYIDNGKIYFNRLNSAYGDFLQYNTNSYQVQLNQSSCDSYFYYDGDVELDKNCYLDTVLLDSFIVALPNVPSIPDPYYGCADCEITCSNYLCGNDQTNPEGNNQVAENEENEELREECLECARHCHLTENCLDTICSECMAEYLDFYENGPEYYEAYLHCADSACTFKDQEMICPACRELCKEDPHGCALCVYEQCISELLFDSCTECSDVCLDNELSDECNRCKHDHQCKGVINSECLNEIREHSNDSSACALLLEHNAVCEECIATCRDYPEQCIPCLNRHCYYQDSLYLIDDMVNIETCRIKQIYPKAKFYKVGNTWYAYQTYIVCPEEDFYAHAPELEAVRVWVAPRDGVVNLTSRIQLLEDNSPARQQSRTADGVRCVIQHNKGVSVLSSVVPARLKADTVALVDAMNIPADDYTAHSKTYPAISVSAGDIFFFYLNSRASHSYDDVNWKQIFVYSNESGTYSSEDDYTCSGSDEFCPDTTAGSIRIVFNATTTSAQTTTLKIYKKHADDAPVLINTQTFSSSSLPLSDFITDSWQEDERFYMVLSGNNLHQVELRPRIIHIRPSSMSSDTDTIVTYLSPQIEFNREILLDSVYYDLFGPLYKGWGQFAVNNITGTDNIALDSLYSSSRKAAIAMNSRTQSGFEQTMHILDTTAMATPGGMETAFSDNGFYNPIDSSCLWVEMKADAKEYRWEAYGRIARISRNRMSNTRDRRASMSYFSDSTVQEGEWEVFDNVVPVPANGQHRVTAIRKKSTSDSWKFSYGIGLGVVGLGTLSSSGSYELRADYMDMNGDRFPDIIQGSSIQYTQPWGGLGGSKIQANSNLFETCQISYGNSFSGTAPNIFSIPCNNPKNNKFASTMAGSVGLNGSQTTTESSTLYAVKDVNGDGLPDKLYLSDNNTTNVYLNIGYDFLFAGTIHGIGNLGKSVCTCSTGNASISPGIEGINQAAEIPNTQVSQYQMSLSVGMSSSHSANETTKQLMDIDGDGLMDIVSKEGELFKIYPAAYFEHALGYSTDYVTNSGMPYVQYSETNNFGLDLAATGGFIILFIKICLGLHGTPCTISETQGKYDLIDMNGDGLPDLVHTEDNTMYVRYNQMGKSGLLKSVMHQAGNRIDLTYRLSDPSIRQPNRQWVLDSVIDRDMQTPLGGNEIVRHFSYSDPYYNPAERTSYGYGCVITEEINRETAGPETVYRKHVRHYNNRDFAERGKLVADSLLDSDGHLYTAYEIGTMYMDQQGRETDDICHDTKVRIGKQTHYMRYYEGGNNPIVTAKQYEYDKYHNVTTYCNFGDTAVADDDLTAEIAYASASSGFNRTHNLVSLPQTMAVSSNGDTVRQMKAVYDEGKLVEYALVNPADTTDCIVTSYAYDEFGLPSQIILPPNSNGESLTLDLQYDDYSHSLPASVTDPFGTSETEYSPLWQLPLSTTDAAGQTILYSYDTLGRLLSITAPGEDSLGLKSVEYSYYWDFCNPHWDFLNSCWIQTNIPCIDIKTFADGTLSTHTRSICDARGRIIQTLDRRGDMWRVSNAARVDNFGREIDTYIPQFVPFDSTLISFSDITTDVLSHKEYDILDRPVSLSWQDGYSSIIGYSIGEDVFHVRRFQQDKADENNNTWQSFTDPLNRQTTAVSPDGAVTAFRYDALGQLLFVTDPDGLTTSYRYDAFGRQIERNHPDAGTTRWTYDYAGNMISSATQRQIDAGVETGYQYSFNRLLDVMYPQNPYNDVHYTYDAAGRITQRADGTGYENFTYDALGNVASSERLIALPTETYPYRFTTRYKYDSFGRMLQIIYPDSEIVDYHYQDGLLSSITGYQPQLQDTVRYISYIDYDEYDRPTDIGYGNDDQTIYLYDPYRSWMTGMQLQSGSGHSLQNISYTYDAVGNITHIEQWDGNVYGMGGAWQTDYGYDVQNRLITATQSSQELGDYYYSLSYSPAGRIGRKLCDTGIDQYYGYKAYNNGFWQSHQIATLFDNNSGETAKLSWDADGQLERIYRPCLEELRQHQWNEAGQLTSFVDNQSCGYYAYDGEGNRTYKLTGTINMSPLNSEEMWTDLFFDGEEVLYVNPYMTITPDGMTKHYYNGSRRIATQIGTPAWLPSGTIVEQGAESFVNVAQLAMQTQLGMFETEQTQNQDTATYHILDIDGYESGLLVLPCVNDARVIGTAYDGDNNRLLNILTAQGGSLGHDIYYYHSDHLGSASWITDTYGSPVQYIHYMPYGELYANQMDTHYDERYKFTGKEIDAETGYGYFGARYYSSVIPQWLSVDPLSDKYPNISPYAYCSWNPINKIDPDGRDEEQRNAAIDMANQYIKMNPDNSYKYGAKGGPGEKVDCSGLVSHCIVAGEESDPNKGIYNGVRNIANNSHKIEDMNDLVAGNLVTFNTGGKYGDYSHIGIITDVLRDDNGNVVDFQFIHSASSTGPTQNNYVNSYWRNKISGFYKWDTRPDVYKGPTLPQITVYGNKPDIMSSARALNVKPISININPYLLR